MAATVACPGPPSATIRAVMSRICSLSNFAGRPTIPNYHYLERVVYYAGRSRGGHLRRAADPARLGFVQSDHVNDLAPVSWSRRRGARLVAPVPVAAPEDP